MQLQFLKVGSKTTMRLKRSLDYAMLSEVVIMIIVGGLLLMACTQPRLSAYNKNKPVNSIRLICDRCDAPCGSE